jgi:hypothetical protein
MDIKGVDFIVGEIIKTVNFVTQPLQGKLLGTGIDLGALFKRGIEAFVDGKAMGNLAENIRENNELKKEAYSKEAEAQIEFKRFQENVFNDKTVFNK